MRIRTIKPEWLDDERLALASSDARTLSIALLLLADDYGRGRANEVVLGARVFPGKDRGTLANALVELANLRYVLVYSVEGQSYFAIRNWGKHQRVDRPGKPQVPAPPKDFEEVPSGPENIRDTHANIRVSHATVSDTHATDQDQDQDQERTRTGKGADASLASPGLPDPNQRQPRAGDIIGPCPKCGAPVQVKFGQRGIWAPCSNRSCDYKLSEVGRVISIGTTAQPPEVDPEVRRYERLLEAETEAMTRNDWKAVERIRGQLEEYANRARAKAARGGA